jgi:stearoyl-CoA desaturase (delta-9 desaturase)
MAVVESPAREDVQVATVRERTSRSSQVVTVIAVVLPPLGLLFAAGLLWGVALSWVDVVLFVALYVLGGLGITVGYHRLFTHRSFETKPWLRGTFAVLGSMTMQGPVTQWVTDHRKHHALSDREGDPHSPHAGREPGVWGATKGFVHAHVGWLFHLKGMERGEQYGKDLYDDRVVRRVDRLYFLWVVLTFAIPFAIGYLVGGFSVSLGFQALVWGGLIRIFAYQHATFSVNSICHLFGRRSYRSRDESRNNWVVAALTFGEGWHNNHHAFPSSARHGLDRFQLDLSWWTIRGLERAGLAWDVRIPDASQRARRRLA